MKKKSLLNSFKYAFAGIFSAFKTERNMKIHFSIMVLVIIAGIVFKISIIEWIMCLFAFSSVIGSEMINTAIETVVDMAMPEKNDLAKRAKDIAAGAVLVSAFFQAIIGLLIFIPKIFSILK